MTTSQTIDGLYVEDYRPGSYDGTILFIHGWPVSGAMFEYQVNTLPERGIRVVTVDLSGFGRSHRNWGPYDCDVWADDVRKVVDSLSLDDITLAGF